ncbi:MAG TPA: hypothetical protein VFQ28_04805, partial [Gaiella sp.]|nr:hypothetical protein [Gaiella sp.]
MGRGAALGGTDSAPASSGSLAPVAIYQQPAPPPRSGSSLALRILGWATLVLAVVAVGTAGGAYLYVHESV